MHRRGATHAAHEPDAGNAAHGVGAEADEKDRGQPEALSFLNRRGVHDPTLTRELDIRTHRVTNWQIGWMARRSVVRLERGCDSSRSGVAKKHASLENGGISKGQGPEVAERRFKALAHLCIEHPYKKLSFDVCLKCLESIPSEEPADVIVPIRED